MQIKQLDVVEQHGILLFRAGDKGKESNVHVFRLSELEVDALANMDLNDEDEEYDDLENSTHLSSSAPTSRAPTARNRSHVKERKLDRTRGCNLYSITRPGGSHLRMVGLDKFAQLQIILSSKLGTIQLDQYSETKLFSSVLQLVED